MRPLRLISLIGMPLLLLTIAAPSAQTPQAPTSPQIPIFRGGVNHVQTSVKVFDKKHQFVSDMRSDEFQVFEDGVRQTLTEVGGSFGGQLLKSWEVTTPVMNNGILLPPPPPKQIGGRLFVIFIDDMHLQASESPKVKQLLHLMGDTLLHPDDLIISVCTGFTACESEGADHDLNHRKLGEVIDKLMGSAATPQEIVDMTATSQGLSELHHRMNTAFRTAYDILDQLQFYTGKQKNFIWISDGYDLDPFKEARLQHAQDMYNDEFGAPNQRDVAGAQRASTDPSLTPGVISGAPPAAGGQSLADPLLNPFSVVSGQFSDTDLLQQMAELIRAANRANVRIYTVDPRGLSAGPPMDVKLSMTDWQDYLQTSIDSLKAIAEETGGFAGVNRNDFDKIFREIDNDSSDFYIIGWDSSNPDPLHRLRKIDIKVTRPGVEAVGYKPSYTLRPRTDPPPDKPAKDASKGRGGRQ